MAFIVARTGSLVDNTNSTTLADTFAFWLDIISQLPLILVSYLILWLLFRYREALFDGLMTRMTGVKLAGIELIFAQREMQAAVRDFDAQRVQKTYSSATVPVRVTRDEQSRVLRRLAENGELVDGRWVLWVDDVPQQNAHEARLLETAGAKVMSATSNADALDLLQRTDHLFDLVISDIARPENEPAGEALAQAMREAGFDLPVIYYISEVDFARPDPAGSFGLTNRPDELFHLILDALERTRPLA